MASLEIALAIAAILGSVTVCAVKILHQVQNSKCRFINCCGAECVRDVEVDLPEAQTSAPPLPTAATALPTSPRPPPPPPRAPALKTVPRPRIKDLRQVFESGAHLPQTYQER